MDENMGKGGPFHVLPFRNIVYFLRVISFIPYKRRIVFIPCSKCGLFFPLTMLTRDLQFSICSGVLSCVLLCATYFFYHKIEMKVCFFFEEVYSHYLELFSDLHRNLIKLFFRRFYFASSCLSQITIT